MLLLSLLIAGFATTLQPCTDKRPELARMGTGTNLREQVLPSRGMNAPIVVPTTKLLHEGEGRGAEIGGPNSAVLFDIDADGVPDGITWPGKGTPLLVTDRNENGIIDDGTELFGTVGDRGHPNGFEKLRRFYRSFDPPEPNKPYIDSGDAAWKRLLLWDDADENAITDPGELKPLGNYLRWLGLGWILDKDVDEHGNAFRWRGWVEFKMGTRARTKSVASTAMRCIPSTT